MTDIGKLRRSQAVTMYGPGAIVDFRAGGNGRGTVSVVVAGLDEWDLRAPPPGAANPQTTIEPRLQEILHVDFFRLPPVMDDPTPGQRPPPEIVLVGARFPKWLQCPRCHRLSQAWAPDDGRDPAPHCGNCTARTGRKVPAVPSRFVAACSEHHLDDFPWHFWVGHKEGCANGVGNYNAELWLEAAAGKAGLAGLLLSCRACKQSKPMEGCFGLDAIAPVGCRGRRPWLAEADEPTCGGTMRGLQRGASNVYFPVTLSALSIPPWTGDVESQLGVYWADAIKKERAGKLDAWLEAMDMHEKIGRPNAEIAKRIRAAVERLEGTNPDRLRWDEYQQLTGNDSGTIDKDESEFEIRHERVPPDLARYFRAIVRVVRLREVRAFRGFTRIVPPSPEGADTARLAAITKYPKRWLPAIEVRGEGVFLDLDRDHLSQWESRKEIQDRAERIDAVYRASHLARYQIPPRRTITPRFLVVHSLAHALVRQLSLECGYSAASIRERLYLGQGAHDMAGVLLYTATPDADGTLGGLSRQGRARRVHSVLHGALHASDWCSSDPLCSAGTTALTEATNLAACHACMMLPETSCEEFNRLLDRATLVGTPEDRTLAFFDVR